MSSKSPYRSFSALFLTTLLMASWPLGIWLARLASGQLPAWMLRLEAPLFRLAGTSPDQSMPWKQYTWALLAFNALGVLVVFLLQRSQAVLPLKPEGLDAVSMDSAFNTAVSFVTNTNWQGSAGESTMGYLTQMLGLAVQNFLSAATGIAVVFALFRGFAAKSTAVIGGDPHIVTEGMAEVAQPGLDFGVRAIGFALRGGCLVEPACLRSGMFQSAEPVVGRRCVILQRWRGIAARAIVEHQSADRAEIVGEQLAVTVVEVEDAGAHGEKMIP